jgi:cobyrinic acid a,c-diamide synthase
VKAFVVAGTASGVGKTTVALAIIAALRSRHLTLQPFKCGPDFIDGGHLALAANRAARNLDTWMLDGQANRETFSRASTNCDLAVVEGMMGLFDGVTGSSDEGSTAEIAKLLDLPVVLVWMPETVLAVSPPWCEGLRRSMRGCVLRVWC